MPDLLVVRLHVLDQVWHDSGVLAVAVPLCAPPRVSPYLAGAIAAPALRAAFHIKGP